MESTDALRKKLAKDHVAELSRLSDRVVNQVSGISGLTELLRDIADEQRRSHFLGLISGMAEDVVDRIQHSITRLQIEADDFQIRQQAVNLSTMVAELLDAWSPACDRKGIVLEGSCGDVVEGAWLAEPNVIRYILVNLVGNAVEFTPSGTIACILSASEGAQSGVEILEIVVRDTGKGMDASRLNDLLAIDSDGSGSDSAATGSTLRLCARLAATMGGRLTGRSVPGEGAEFTLSLPLERICRSTGSGLNEDISKGNWILVDKANLLPSVIGGLSGLRRLSAPQVIAQASGSDNVVWIVQDERDMENCIHAARRAENPEGWHVFLPRREYGRMLPWCKAVAIEPYVRPVMPSHLVHMIGQRIKSNAYRKQPLALSLNVLIAEDNQVCSTVLSAILRKWNCRFLVVDNGKDALEKLAEQPDGYDAILMNCEMPVMDGFMATQILRSMKDEYPSLGAINVIGMTSSNDSEMLVRARDAGMDGCLRKPIRLNELYDLLERSIPVRPVIR